MNKTVIVAGVLILLVGAAVAAFFLMSEDAPLRTAQEHEGGQGQEQRQEESGVGEWIAGLASGKRMECEYRMMGEGGAETSVKMYAERDRYRTEVMTPQGKYISISDGKTTYSFLEGSKEGVKMDMECMKDQTADLPKVEGMPEQESFVSSEEAIGNVPGISCRETGSIDVFVPSDVRFIDQCSLLKQQTEMMKQYQDQLPPMPESVRDMMGQ